MGVPVTSSDPSVELEHRLPAKLVLTHATVVSIPVHAKTTVGLPIPPANINPSRAAVVEWVATVIYPTALKARVHLALTPRFKTNVLVAA